MKTKAEILEGLNEQQKEAVVNYHGKVSLEATPGSGKSHTLVSRCQYMIKDGVKPSKILAFTFTKKAAEELRERIRNAIGAYADKMTVLTYHSFCGRILRQFANYAGRTENFTIYDEDDKKDVLGKIHKEYFKNKNYAPVNYSVIANCISRFKLKNLSPKQAQSFMADNTVNKIAGFIYESYEKEMKKRNAFDFDDLPYFAFRIADRYPEVREYLASRYEYIMSDENQDANKQNLEFILMLGSKCNNIMVVGDTDQSIYGFRGADVNNVIDTYKRENFQLKYLSTNYRSTQTIVKAANAVIKNNRKRIAKECDTINEVGDKIVITRCQSAEIENEYICKKIAELKETNPDLKYKDIAVLGRLQRHAARIEEAFLRHKIPYRLKGLVPFYSRTEIKDILAYLKLAVNHQDLTALERVINVPARGIGRTSLSKFLLSDITLDDIIDNEEAIRKMSVSAKARRGILEFSRIIGHIRKMISGGEPVSAIISYIINAIEYKAYLEKEVKVASTKEEKIVNINELEFISHNYDSVHELLLNAVLDEPSKEKKDIEEAGDAVNIMTMHSSKGLEFKVVFIMAVSKSVMPAVWREKEEDESIVDEEERRLFYVAMTRAKKKLYITFPISYINGQGSRVVEPLPCKYVNEIPPEFRKNYSV